MIEQTIRDYLTDIIEVPVYMEVPENPPVEFIVLEKTGSGLSNRIYSATITIQSYGPSLYDAACLNEQVKEAMDSSVVLDEISAARLNSDYNYTDTSTKRYRYQAVYDITHY